MLLTQTRLVVAALALAYAPISWARPGARPAQPTTSAWIAAAKAATLNAFGNYGGSCDSTCTVGSWLTKLVRGKARAVRWTVGRCRLTNELNPLDAGTGAHCVQAVVDLHQPRGRADRPEIEVYLESPRGERPGNAYAFRGLMVSADGPDYTRFPEDFESDWTSRFPADGSGPAAGETDPGH